MYDQTTWENNPINQQHRIYSQTEDPPYLDDFFRADDRFGPNPRYGDVALPASVTIGDEITGNLLSAKGISDQTLTRENAISDDADGVGLDGYWERRARQNGLRLMTGQRLELGNAFGWGGLDQNGQRRSGDNEPLKPWDGCVGSNNSGRCNEARHRLTLRDNLAAVQATAVYHSSSGTPDDDTPAACLATTVHPGNPATLINSATFRDIPTDLKDFWGGTWFANKPFISNFFTGQGTNGWEYGVHPNAAIDGNSDATIRALHNLAYYAGDPNGGAPSFSPVQDNVVHPYPDMAMWGDFSVLRRIFDELWSGGYSSLSIADKATLRSAACTVGMLAYNIGYLENMDYSQDAANKLITLSNAINALGLPADAPPEAVIDGLTGDNKILATLVMVKEQLERDRLFGFQEGFQITGTVTNDDFESNSFSGGSGNWTTNWTRSSPYGLGDSSNISIQNDASDRALRLSDQGLWAYRRVNLAGLTNPYLRLKYRRQNLGNSSDSLKIRIYNYGWTDIEEISGGGTDADYQEMVIDLAAFNGATPYIVFETSHSLSSNDYIYIDDVDVFDGEPYISSQCKSWTNGLDKLCTDYPKYPILNALFPFSDHDEVAKLNANTMATRDGAIPAYLQTENADTSIQYRSINLKDSSTLSAIALEPKQLEQWTLPHGSLSNGSNPTSNQEKTIV
ncbi:MAG: hypothetical protein AAGE92_16250, partial [Cyanobacteria bacterium P01_G01_bin.4]